VKILEQAFMEATDNALPHLMEDAYLEACHANNMVECYYKRPFVGSLYFEEIRIYLI
jgi:hypothetical protein